MLKLKINISVIDGRVEPSAYREWFPIIHDKTVFFQSPDMFQVHNNTACAGKKTIIPWFRKPLSMNKSFAVKQLSAR